MPFKWIKKFIDYFFKYSPGLPDLQLKCIVDVDKVVSDFGIERAAEQSGVHDLPSSEAEQPDDTERKVYAYIEKRMSDITAIANEKLAQYNTAISNTNVNSEIARTHNIADYAKLRLDGIMSEANQMLRSLKDDADRFAAQLNEFRRQNVLSVDAEYPDSTIFHYAVAFFMLFIEAAMNGYFFAKGSELGYLGGVSQSLIIAALNILPAFSIVGMFILRYRIHIATWVRVLANILLITYLAWAVTFNLVVAHFRDLLRIDPENAITLAFDRFVSTPLHLSDLDSWLLFCVGMFFSIIAAYDGYRSDDRYPHYGRRQRAANDVHRIYIEESNRIVQEAANIRETFIGEIEDLDQKAGDLYTHLYNLVELKKSLIDKHRHCIDDFISGGNAIIQKYRTVNRMKRTSNPPSYFGIEWRPNRIYSLIGTKDDDKKVEEQKHHYEDFPALKQRMLNEIELVYGNVFDMLQQIDPSITRINNVTGMQEDKR